MPNDDWWSGDYNDSGDSNQTSAAPDLFSQQNLGYSAPGQNNPVDQWNYAADPNAAGGWMAYPPGTEAPSDLATFSNNTGQYPDANSASNAIANTYVPYQGALNATVDQAGNAAWMQGWNQMQGTDQQVWQNTYGSQAAPYVWGQQTGNYQASPEFNALDQQTQNLFYGTYGADAPQVWAQQNAANQAAAGGGAAGGGVNPWSIPWGQPGSLAQGTAPHVAGTTGTPYGQGWIQSPGSPGYAVTINPANLPYLSNPALAPGYINGSGTYNQFNLSQPLFGTVPGSGSNQIVNMNYGVGGPGDPTNGSEPQTPQQWINGDRLFTWNGNMGTKETGTEGLGYIATLFGRSDTSSGISTAAWSAPEAFWQGLYGAINKGTVKPSARGWQFLQQERHITPQQIGGAAPANAAAAGTGGSGSGTGPMGPGTEPFNQAQAYQMYLTARMNNLEIPGMNQQNAQFQDQMAFNRAKEQWMEQYQQSQAAEAQRQFNQLQAIREAGLTGTFNGQQTQQALAQQQQTAMQYLTLMSQLRGPGDIFQYMKVLNGTPAGIQDVVNAAAGAYRMPTTGGGQVTVGGYSNPSDISTLLSQMNNPNFGAEAKNLNLPPPNQINALNLQRMSPSQRQMLLAAYEQAGYRPEDVVAIFQNSLPQYTSQAQQSGTGRVNLFGR